MKRTILIIAVLLFIITTTTFAQKTETVEVYVPEFPVVLNGVEMNPMYSQYPLIVYQNVTYIPMTFNISQSLGVQAAWSQSEGLDIMTIVPNGDVKEYIIEKRNPSTLNAEIPSFNIVVNGVKVDNSKEQYPILTYGGITYFPLTWHFVVDEFNWDLMFDFDEGLEINTNQNTKSFNSESMNSQTVVIDKTKNIYTQEYLQNLVDTTPITNEISEFRSNENSRRDGQVKVTGKYFDMYHPDEQKFHDVANLLKPHMDKVYMMLTDLYGFQAHVEVHLIDPEMVETSEEGNIRYDEHITFIWVEASNDGKNGVNNIAEFVHEINHNFFEGQSITDPHIGAKNMWINEAHAKMIGSLYSYYLPEYKDISQFSFYEPIYVNADVLPTIIEAEDNHLVSEDGSAWDYYHRDTFENDAITAGLIFWWNVYNQNSLDIFKSYLRQLGVNRPGLDVMIDITGLTKDELNNKYMQY